MVRWVLFLLLTVGFALGMALPAHGLTSASSKPSLCDPAWRWITLGSPIDSSTFSAARAEDGYVYFGGRDGLYRAEGVRAHRWYPDPYELDSLPGGYVRALEPADGGLFVGTSGGLAWFDLQTETFKSINLGLAPEQRVSIYALKILGHQLYVGHEHGGSILDLSTLDVIGQFQTGGESTEARVYDLEVFRGGIAAISKHSVQFVRSDGVAQPLLHSRTQAVEASGFSGAIADDNALWLANGPKALIRVPEDRSKPSTTYTDEIADAVGQGNITSIEVDQNNHLWIGTDLGLARWELADPSSPPVRCRTTPATSLDQPALVNLLWADPSGGMMVGFRGRAPIFGTDMAWARRFLLRKPTAQGLLSTRAWDAIEDRQGRLLIATLDGLFRETAQETGEFERLAIEALGDQPVRTVLEAPNGHLWIGTYDGLFILSDGGVRRIPLLLKSSGEPMTDRVVSMALHRDAVLVGTDNGLFAMDWETGDIDRFFRMDPGYTAHTDVPITDIADTWAQSISVIDDHVFVAGSQFVQRLNIASGQVEATTEGVSSFEVTSVSTVDAAPNGFVYVGTDTGLVATDYDFASFEYLTRVDGLRTGSVIGLAADSRGGVWHTSNYGIAHWDPTDGNVRALTVDDGLHTKRSNSNALHLIGTSKLIVSNGAGVSVLDTATVASPQTPVPEVLRYQIGSDQHVHNGGELHLQPSNRDLTLTFGAPFLRIGSNTSIEFRYASAGEASEVRRIPAGDALNLFGLAPGRYDLSTRFIEPGRQVSDWSVTTIIVEPFWWERSSFYIVLMILGALGAGVLSLRRYQTIRHQYSLVADERKRIAQDLHDTFMQEVFGARMLGRSLADDQDDDENKAKAEKILGLLDTATASVRASVNQLTGLTDVSSLADDARSANLAEKYGESFQVTVREEGKAWRLGTQRRSIIARIVREAMNNACKHARASEILVTFNWTWFGLRITVDDDGRGFDPTASAVKQGFGIGAMGRLARAARALLRFESAPGEGARVELSVSRIVFY